MLLPDTCQGNYLFRLARASAVLSIALPSPTPPPKFHTDWCLLLLFLYPSYIPLPTATVKFPLRTASKHSAEASTEKTLPVKNDWCL